MIHQLAKLAINSLSQKLFCHVVVIKKLSYFHNFTELLLERIKTSTLKLTIILHYTYIDCTPFLPRLLRYFQICTLWSLVKVLYLRSTNS